MLPTITTIRFIITIVSDIESCVADAGMPTREISLTITLSNLKQQNLNDTYVSFLKSSQFTITADEIASDTSVAHAAPAMPMSRV